MPNIQKQIKLVLHIDYGGFENIWKEEIFPSQWKEGLVCPEDCLLLGYDAVWLL
jgi:hypothetical protein